MSRTGSELKTGRQRESTPHRYLFSALALLMLVAFAGCGRPSVRANPTPVPTPAGSRQLADREATELIDPETGGVVGLRSGVEISLPPQSISDSAVVSLRAEGNPPPAPAPRSIIGEAYELSLEGGSLTGVALLQLPLPPNMPVDQYDIAPYRWNGRTWERLAGRLTGQALRVGVNTPALFAVLGQWRMADASLSVHTPPAETGRPTIPVEVRGQYRYRTPPLQQHDYTPARLILKHDSSGGAGQAGGDESLDRTVAEAPLIFKPDPGRSQGVIEFSYKFDVTPAALGIPLGSVIRFYAVLIVDDSAAPTRRLSTGGQYLHLVPIQAIGTEVVGPELLGHMDETLRWHVLLNGQTLFVRPASDLRLSLAEVLAQGGLGEYKIMLEAVMDQQFVPISNEVTVQLALPATPAPVAMVTPEPQPYATATPTPAPTSPFGTMPPTPTRRTPPEEQMTPTPTATLEEATPTPSLVPTATRPSGVEGLWADSYSLAPGECTIIHWIYENVREVYFGDTPTTGVNETQVCPDRTTTYTVRVVSDLGEQLKAITIAVRGTEQSVVNFEFYADRYQISRGEAVMLHWRATNASGVYLNDQGVAGEASQEVRPETNTNYTLRVEPADGSPAQTKTITINVAPAETIPIRFWAEQYTFEPGGCTRLHWYVEGVEEVFYTNVAGERGVEGVGASDECPETTRDYVLRARAGDRQAQKIIRITVGASNLGQNEAIFQGQLRAVEHVDDVDGANAGLQPGWRLTIDGAYVLHKGPGPCCDATVILNLTDTQISTDSTFLDWPLNPDQLVEVRASCSNNNCLFGFPPNAYLKLRQQ